MIPPALGRFLRYWYTYRTVVAVLLGILVSGSMYWLYTQQVACDNQDPSCTGVRISLHPEDRLFFESTDPNIVLIGIDDASVRELGKFPLDRADYATALDTLNKDQAGVAAFDIGFSDPGRSDSGDNMFATSLRATKVPVVLAYGSSGELRYGDGQILMTGTRSRCTSFGALTLVAPTSLHAPRRTPT